MALPSSFLRGQKEVNCTLHSVALYIYMAKKNAPALTITAGAGANHKIKSPQRYDISAFAQNPKNMKVTLNKQTEGGYNPETVNVESISWGFASKTATLHISGEEFTEKYQAVIFAQTYGIRIHFNRSTVSIEVNAEYISEIYF